MFFTQNFRIGLSMLGQSTYISNKGFLSILQDVAEMHSASIGIGVTDIDKTNFSWALLNWKVKIISRPKYGETLTVKTWSRYSTKLYSYRDFEVYNESGDLIAIATSKWILIDAEKRKIAKIEDDMISKYEPEDKSVFNIVELDKLDEPENIDCSIKYKIRKADIDINNHVNNLCYVDIALEGYPGSINDFNSITELEIQFKHQIRITDDITVSYSSENNENCIMITSKDGEKIHSIVKFK